MPARHIATLTTVALACTAARGQWVEDDCLDLASTQGVQNGSLFGDRVADVGDVTGDGVPDFAVTAPFFNTNRGSVSMHSGVDGAQIWLKTTSITSTILGFSLATIGDLDDDGVRDVISGALFAPNTGGFVFVYSGVDGHVLHTFQGDPNGFAASLGYSISTGGDFDGDGIEDIAIGDGSNDDVALNAGRVSIHTSDGFDVIAHLYPPDLPVGRFGTGSAFLGDVNGDGRDDIVVADRYVANEPPGRLHVFSYDGKQPVLLYTIEPVNLGCVLCGDNVRGGRDLDGDGVGDIAIGEPTPDMRVRAFSGADGAPILTIDDPPVQTVALVDDVDGDGLADIFAADTGSDAGGSNAGAAHLFAGSDGTLLRSMTSTSAGMGFGTRVAPCSDVDGDGVMDLLVGARTGIGHAFVMSGGLPSNSPDINGDGVVDVSDLVLLFVAWGACDECGDCPADLIDDCVVDVQDLVALITAWG